MNRIIAVRKTTIHNSIQAPVCIYLKQKEEYKTGKNKKPHRWCIPHTSPGKKFFSEKSGPKKNVNKCFPETGIEGKNIPQEIIKYNRKRTVYFLFRLAAFRTIMTTENFSTIFTRFIFNRRMIMLFSKPFFYFRQSAHHSYRHGFHHPKYL